MRQIKIHKQIIKQVNANRVHMGAMLQRGTKLACNIMDDRWYKQRNILVAMSYLRI